MGRQGDRQQGFSIVEAVLVVAVLGVIGVAGWFVYQHNRVKITNAATGTQTSKQGTNQQTNTTTTTTTNQSVVKIPELGIQITVPDDIKDVTYKIGHSGTFKNGQSGVDAFFSTTSLTAIDSKCGTDFGPLGTLTMGDGQYPSDDPTAYSDYGGNLVKQFPTFFISYTGPQAGCSENSIALNAMNKFKQEFEAALSTIQALN